MKKRGLSDVITTTFLILLTIVLISVMGYFLIPFITESLGDSTLCNKSTNELTIISEESCYDYLGNYTNITLRLGNVDIDGVYIFYKNSSGSFLSEEYTEINDLPEKGGGQKTYYEEGIFENVGTGTILDGKRCPISQEIEIERC